MYFSPSDIGCLLSRLHFTPDRLFSYLLSNLFFFDTITPRGPCPGRRGDPPWVGPIRPAFLGCATTNTSSYSARFQTTRLDPLPTLPSPPPPDICPVCFFPVLAPSSPSAHRPDSPPSGAQERDSVPAPRASTLPFYGLIFLYLLCPTAFTRQVLLTDPPSGPCPQITTTTARTSGTRTSALHRILSAGGQNVGASPTFSFFLRLFWLRFYCPLSAFPFCPLPFPPLSRAGFPSVGRKGTPRLPECCSPAPC
jgi:hypothetical protein